MGEVTWEKLGGVAIVTLSSPEVRNGLDAPMAVALFDACVTIDADLDIGCTVIRGANGTFCSGADTRDWHVMSNPASQEAFTLISTIYDSFARVGRLSMPVVAAVRGSAVGAGLNLMLAADLRVVSRDAKILSGFLRIGLHPGGGFFTLAGRVASRETVAALGLFNATLSGEEAVERGLAWEAADDDAVESRALELAEQAAHDPELARRAIGSLRAELGPPSVSWPTALEMERGLQMWSQHRRHQSLENNR
jgi:enoyl-CoA hydratase